MRYKVLGIVFLITSLVAGFAQCSNIAPSVGAEDYGIFHSTVSVSASTTTLTIPASSQCRITNPGTGYTGSVAVSLTPSTSSVPVALQLNFDATSSTPAPSFVPNNGATSYLVYTNTQGTLDFTGTGGTGSTLLIVDCNKLPQHTQITNVITASIPPAPQPSPLYTVPVSGTVTAAISSLPPVAIASLPPVTVNTEAPFVPPTCPASPKAPCVQFTGPPLPQPSPLYTMPVSGSVGVSTIPPITIGAPTDDSGNLKVVCEESSCTGGGGGGGQTFPTSSPGNAQEVVLANPSATPYTAANPFPVTTPLVPTPIPTLANELSTTAPLPVSTSQPVIGQMYWWNGAGWIAVTASSPLPVTTPAPVFTANQTVSGTVAVNTPFVPTPIPTLPGELSTTAPQPVVTSEPIIGQIYWWNGSGWIPVSTNSPLPVTTPAPAYTANQTISGTVTANQGTNPWIVNTPGPAPTCTPYSGGTNQAICIADINPTAAPAPTVSPNTYGVQEVGPATTVAVNGGNVGVIDSNGNRRTTLCGTSCGGVTQGFNQNIPNVGLIPKSSTLLNATVSTGCSQIVANGSSFILYAVVYASSTAQTGTLQLYNDTNCTNGDQIYERTDAPATTYDNWIFFESDGGLYYKWTSAGAAGFVYALYF